MRARSLLPKFERRPKVSLYGSSEVSIVTMADAVPGTWRAAEPAGLDQTNLINRAVQVLARDDRVLGVWLAGSFGRGSSDQFSDVDFWVVVQPDDVDRFCDDWPMISDQIAPIVLRKQFPGRPVFTQVTSDWIRFDLSIGTPPDVERRTASTLRAVHDPHDLSARLQESGPARQPDPERVTSLTQEFLRVLGLLAVVVGRGEYIVAEMGAGLALNLLVDLMLEDVAVEDRGGAMSLNRLLPAERLRSLLDLPAIEATRESVINVHLACAAVLLPLARDLHVRCDLPWPQSLEDALRRHLHRQLAVTLNP